MKTLQTLTYNEWVQWCQTLPTGSIWWLPDTVIEHFETILFPYTWFDEHYDTPVFEITYKHQIYFRRQSYRRQQTIKAIMDRAVNAMQKSFDTVMDKYYTDTL